MPNLPSRILLPVFALVFCQAAQADAQRTRTEDPCPSTEALPMAAYDLRLMLSPLGHPWPFATNGADGILARIAARLPPRDVETLHSGEIRSWEALKAQLVPALESEVSVTIWRDGRFSGTRVVVSGLLPALASALEAATMAAGHAGDLRPEHWVSAQDSVYARLLLRLEPRAGLASRSIGSLLAPLATESTEAVLRSANPFTADAIQFGDPLISFTIGANGRPEPASIRVIGAENRHVERHLSGVVRSWRYRPATVAGCAVRESFTFSLGSAWH